MSQMSGSALAAKCREIAEKYNTVYAKGMIGNPVTQAAINTKTAQYGDWYNKNNHKANLEAKIGKNYFGFDCVCLIKSILWGWNGDASASYGGAKYLSNGVPDIGADQIINVCSDVSGDYTNIIPGELLWMSGHVGIYIGGGLAVECTLHTADKLDGVIVSAVKNIGEKDGCFSRAWTKHGKLPYCDYPQPEASSEPDVISVNLPVLERGDKQPEVKTLQRLLNALDYKDQGGSALAVDGSFGAKTLFALRSCQTGRGLALTGKADKAVWESLLNG